MAETEHHRQRAGRVIGDAVRRVVGEHHTRAPTSDPLFSQLNNGLVICYNGSADTDCDTHQIMILEGTRLAPTDQNLREWKRSRILKAGVGTTNAAYGNWVIAQRPVPHGKSGPCFLYGYAVCKVNIRNTGHDYADIYSEPTTRIQANLQSGDCGKARIIQREDNQTGVKWCGLIISPNPSGLLSGTLDGDLNQAGSQTIDTSFATVYDWSLSASTKLVSGAKVWAAWRRKQWVVMASDQCEVAQ